MSYYRGKYLLTNDVETTSIVNHCLSNDTGKLVAQVAIPKILNIYEKLSVKATFFVTGYFAENFPKIVKLIYDKGHEIGCHGYSHEHADGFDLLSFNEQVVHLTKAKTILENIIDEKVISFRSPALRSNRFTVTALEKTGFEIDSSVSSQRFDFFLSLGSREKLKWLIAPRKPYFTSNDSLSQSGKGHILEIPISALVIPYIGTTMRISPAFIRLLRYFLMLESLNKGNPINFLIHPIELIEEKRSVEKIQRRSNNLINYLLKDKLRHILKMNNLGQPSINLLTEQIEFFKRKNFDFITCKDLYYQTKQ